MDDLFEKTWFWIILVAVVIAGGVLYFGIDDIEEDVDVAIRVNDREITHSEFDQMVDQVTQEFQMYGMQADEEQIKEQAIDRAIQEALLMEYADSEGLEASTEEIDQEFEETMTMYGAQTEEEFLAQLEMQGIESKEEVENLLAMEIKINKLLELYEEDIEITDEEMQEAYEEYSTQMEQMEQEVSSFEEMEERLRESLMQEQITPLILSKVEELEAEAEIEIFIDEEDVDVEEPEEAPEMEMQPEGGEIEIEIDEDDISEEGELELSPEDLE